MDKGRGLNGQPDRRVKGARSQLFLSLSLGVDQQGGHPNERGLPISGKAALSRGKRQVWKDAA